MLEGGFGSLGKNDGDGEDGEEDRGGATEGVGQVALDDVWTSGVLRERMQSWRDLCKMSREDVFSPSRMHASLSTSSTAAIPLDIQCKNISFCEYAIISQVTDRVRAPLYHSLNFIPKKISPLASFICSITECAFSLFRELMHNFCRSEKRCIFLP